jgi:cation transport regulator ChaC
VVARYFAYGSNMNPERVRSRGIRFVHASAARLPGFSLTFDKSSSRHPGVGHANVRLDRGAVVEGVLYWLEEADEIAKMDRFESTPVNYSREVVRVQVAREAVPGWLEVAQSGADDHPHALVETWTYFANPAVRRADLRPPRSYLNHLLAGRPYLSQAYYETLASWPCDESR